MARIYATNAIRKRNEALNFLRMGARFDAVASQISSAVTSGMVSNTMANVVKGLEKAVQTDNVEKVSIKWCPTRSYSKLSCGRFP